MNEDFNKIKTSNFHRRNLLIFRCGNKSLHKEIYPLPKNRNWDLALLCYEDISEADIENADFIFSGGIFKWQAFNEMQKYLDLDNYDYTCVSDDDISFLDVADIERIFEHGEKFHLDLFQPSLSQVSAGVAWNITLHHPTMAFRNTNFVEVMIPVFSRKALRILRKYNQVAVSGYGLDVAWTLHKNNYNDFNVGVLDLVQVIHTRPIDKVNGDAYSYLRSKGIDIYDEVNKFAKIFNASEVIFQNIAYFTMDQGLKFN